MRGTFLRGPYNKDCGISGCILGAPLEVYSACRIEKRMLGFWVELGSCRCVSSELVDAQISE